MSPLKAFNLSEEAGDLLKLTALKILPRFILAVLLSLLFSSLDNYASVNEVISFTVLFCLLIFYFLPPAIDTLYVLKKTGDKDADDLTLLRLLRASKDNDRGVFVLAGSLVIKSSYGKTVKYFDKLKERLPFAEHEVIRQEKSKRKFTEDYFQLLESVSWKLESGARANIEIYDLNNLDAINL